MKKLFNKKAAAVVLAGALGIGGYTLATRDTIPQTHLNARDVNFVLGCNPARPETQSARDAFGNAASYSCKPGPDGTGLRYTQDIHFRGKDYHTEIVAESLSPEVYDIKSLIFDNQPEKLRNAKEIYSVINYIGNQERVINYRQMPWPHENKGQFSPLGRFVTRHAPQSRDGGFF